MPVYYPSCVAHFKLRFDESLHVVSTPAPTSVPALVADPTVQISARPVLQPLVLQRGSQNISYILNRVPMKASMKLSGYRQAATFSLTIPYKDLPIDPRTLRSCAVELHLGTVPAEDFAEGMRSRGQNGRRSILTTRGPDGEPREDTLVMVGLVDEWDVGHGGDNSIVELSGRDMRGILLDSPMDPAVLQGLDLDTTIDDVVRQLLAAHPFGSQFTVEVNDAEWPNLTVPRPAAADLVPRHQRGAAGNRRGGRASAPAQADRLNFWDMIVRFCFMVGAIPYFVGTSLRIRPSRSIYDQQRAGFDPTIATPFLPDRPRQVGSGEPFSVRRLLYGHDLMRVNIKRKFAGNTKPKTVRCVSLNLSTRERGATGMVVEGRWPPSAPTPRNQAARTQTVAPGGQTSAEDILNVPVPNITDPARLAEVARSIFEEIGRNEITGTCEVPNVASFGGSNQDPDMLRLRPGDAVEFYTNIGARTARNPLVATVVDFNRESFESVVSQVAERIGDENLARVIVATARGQVAEIQRFFRVSNVDLDWSAEDGAAVSFNFQNYIESRFNVDPVNPQPGVVARSATERRT